MTVLSVVILIIFQFVITKYSILPQNSILFPSDVQLFVLRHSYTVHAMRTRDIYLSQCTRSANEETFSSNKLHTFIVNHNLWSFVLGTCANVLLLLQTNIIINYNSQSFMYI